MPNRRLLVGERFVAACVWAGRVPFRRTFAIDIVLRFCMNALDMPGFGVIASMRGFENLEIGAPQNDDAGFLQCVSRVNRLARSFPAWNRT